MIRENQALLNRLNVLSDGLIIYLMLPAAFWLRFYVLRGPIGVPLRNYLVLGLVFTLIQLFTYATFGLYHSFRKSRIRQELALLWEASFIDLVILFSWLFLSHDEHYSRGLFALFFILSVGALSVKRYCMRRFLRRQRRNGNNQKTILLVGSGDMARQFLNEVRTDRELGFQVIGYISRKTAAGVDPPYLGGYEALENILLRYTPDEVVSAIDPGDYDYTAQIIDACEKSGTKLSIIPFYAAYMPARPQFDDLNGIPLLNIRRIPLDNFGNAFIKRAMDIVGAAVLLVLTAPITAVCALVIKLTSPGPVIFRQVRVGRGKKNFTMYKLRTMRVNKTQDTAWSAAADSRRTAFGSFLRKCSIDEFPQFWNVLKGDMSLVGPRPEIPHFVDRFKEEIPLYMVRHQVRPGITGWAQINGLRGDTPIKARVEHDIYYIENWSPQLDIQILLSTVFRGKFINDEQL